MMVTFHAVSKKERMWLVAMDGENQLLAYDELTIQAMSNDEVIDHFREKVEWYEQEMDPEIIWRSEIVRNPKKYAVKWRGGA